ncbi:hypothetical protein CYK37_11085 [Mesorhizobium loti]|nr:hypothetical protein CYK37_11085 [Mesorhizobium loti]
MVASRPMRTALLTALALLTAGSTAHALDSRLKAGLLKLDPQTRLEQRCDAEVLDRITHDDPHYKADRVVAYAFGQPEMTDDSIKSKGAAFRSRGEWYRLKFKCETAPDHMEVLNFKYRIGDRIEKADWSRYYLYP